MSDPDPEVTMPLQSSPVAEYRCVCGHVITIGSSSVRCPECGREFDSAVLRAATAETAWFDASQATTTRNDSITQDADDPLIGTHLDHFEVLQRIGGGGMGTVYRALDESLQRYVALKVLRRPSGAESLEIQSLFEEARAQARVNHPHVAHIYYVGRHAETPYLAMELVGTETLAQRMQRDPIPFQMIVRVAIQVTQALQAAARFDIVHGDIKPANVLMVDDNAVKLSDFGLAYRLSEAGEQFGKTAGTPDYMPPEATNGQRINHRGDMYSLGVTLFVMTFGRMPYSSTSSNSSVQERLRQHREAEVEFPATWPTEVPRSWREMLEQLLAKDPNRRFTDFDSLLDELRQFQPTAIAIASPLLRGMAWVVDAFFVAIPLILIAVFAAGDPSGIVSLALSIAACLGVASIQATFGTTLGKRLFQIRIVDQHGLRPSRTILATRSVFQFLFAWAWSLSSLVGLFVPGAWLPLLGIVLLFLVIESIAVILPNQRSIHDRILQTLVVLDSRTS